MISLIWAMDRNGLCGKDNLLPWHYKEDLIYFKNMTKGKTVLMGDKTYESLCFYYKGKTLPFGKKYVASLNFEYLDDCIIVKDVKQFLESNKEDIIVIGGKTIYSLSLDYADYLYVTIIDKEHEGNIYFPKVDFSKFKLVNSVKKDILNFLTYERKR